MDASNEGASRRDILKGIAIGSASLVLGPVMALGSEEQMSGKSLSRASAASLGIDPGAVVAFIEEVNKQVGGLHSMMLVRHGKVAAEAWWKPYEAKRPHILFSLSKSFCSTAVGLAVTDKFLTVEDKVSLFFPDKLPAKVSENLAAMRVKDLLTMNTGHEAEPGRTTQDWVKEFLAAPVQRKPGTHFLYNTSATHILAAIVEKKTGKGLMEYLKPRLLDPLAIEGATWDKSPAGVTLGGYGMSVRTEDIAKFGQLYLQKGKWKGKQLIPESWVAEATSRQVPNGDPSQENDWSQGYGYQFWRSRHGFYRGDGAFGQYCIVMEEFDAVLAITSGVGDMGKIMAAAWTHLLPGFKSVGGTPSDFAKKLSSQEVPSPVGKTSSGIAAQVSGKSYVIDANTEGIRSVKLSFQGDRATIETTRNSGTAKVVCGTKDWVRGEVLDGGIKRPIATKGAWVSESKFSLRSCYVDGPFEWNETYEFDGDKLTVSGRGMNVAFGPGGRPSLKGKQA